MGLADELAKLEELRRRGVLSEMEFARAKEAILNGAGSGSDPSVGQVMSEQLSDLRYQNELARIDREWEAERERYMITSRYGVRQLPTPGMGTVMAVVGGIFGMLWTVFAFALTSSAPDVGPFPVVKVVFPLFGVVFTIGAIATGLYARSRAIQYQQAYEAYLARRADMRAPHSAREQSPPLPREFRSSNRPDDRYRS